MSTVLNEMRIKCEGHVKAYTEALKNNDFKAMTTIEANLKEAEDEYNLRSRNELFDRCQKADDPVLAGVIAHNYPILRHKLVKDDGIVTGIEIVDDRTKQIDLIQLCKWCELPTLWRYKVEKMGELLCLRSAKALGMTEEEIKTVSKTYRMDKLARAEKMGETPTSNTQLCKMLQTVVDAIMFKPNDSGSNAYRVNNHDVAYLLMCYTKRGRKQLFVTVAKESFLHNLVVDVLHRLATGKRYGLDYQQVKAETGDVTVKSGDAEPAPEKAKAAPKKAKPAKAEPEAVVVPRECVVPSCEEETEEEA